MKILIAPDSFKGCLSASDAAKAVADGVKRIFPQADIVLAPIADGGEGTVEALVLATGGRFMKTLVQGPLGKPVEAQWGILGDIAAESAAGGGKTAVIEMAAASGLPLLDPALYEGKDVRDPLRASTYGTGELLKAALDLGVSKVVMGIGGSATNDGGSGFAKALGVRFLDAAGQELPPGGAALANLKSVDLSGLDPRLRTLEVLVACDVDNPLCGPKGASAVYGPQKGATPEMVAQLDAALANFAEVCTAATGKNAALQPGAGAAGGLGAGLLFFTNAKLLSGARLIMDTMQLPQLLRGVDLVITGEGSTNFQTVFGKAPIAVAKLSKENGAKSDSTQADNCPVAFINNIPVICISGGLGEGADDVYAHGIDAMLSAVSAPMTLESCLSNGREFLADASERACRLINVGRSLKS